MFSLEEQELMVRTYEATHDADLTADIFGINKINVYKWVRIYRKNVTSELRTNQRGRKRILTSEDDEKIKELIGENNDITNSELNEKLGCKVSDETVRKRAIELGYRRKKKSLYVSERDRLRCKKY